MPSAAGFPFDLVMFDLDGTLLETAPELADAVNDTLAALGLGRVEPCRVHDWIGNGVRALLACALAEASGEPVPGQRLDRALELFAARYCARCGSNSRPYPGVEAVLRQWRALGTRLALVTNKDGRFTDLLLERHGLARWFDRVIAGDTLARKKPAPDGILACLAHFGVARARSLFIGDSAIDVASARNAGVRVWVRAGGYNLGQPIEDCQPDRVFHDYAELSVD